MSGSHPQQLGPGVAPLAGQASEEALKALARAFGVARGDVTLVTGARSRSKIVDVAGATPEMLAGLLAGGP